LKATYGSLGIRETLDSPESTVGIVARWELFSGFESANHRKVAAAQLVKAKAELDNNRVHILSRAEQLRNQLKSISSRLEFEQKNQKQIERFLKAVQDEYRRGFKNSNDLKSALELVLDTQINKGILRADYFEARAELQEILGIELKEL
jgi:outer membrane protein TolC